MLNEMLLDDDEEAMMGGGGGALPVDDGIPVIQAGAKMPNTPRDPDDPREKLARELERKYGNEKMSMSPEARQADRGSREALLENNQGIAFQKLLANAASAAGTIGGKSASTAGFDKFANDLTEGNNAAYSGIMKDRAALDSADNKRLEIMKYLADRRGKDEATALNYGIKKQGLEDANNRFQTTSEIARERNAITAKGVDQKTGKTAGTDAVDKDYAKDYNDWRGVGRGQFQKNLKLLEDAEKELAATPDSSNISGNWVGRVHDSMRLPEGRLLQQKVQEAAQGGLKATLGAQFTEREGQQIMARAYDPTLPPSMNKGKIRDAINQLKENQRINEAKARYYEENGTLRGFTDAGPQRSPDDQNETGLMNKKETKAPPAGKIHVRKGSENYWIDPADLEQAKADKFEVVQ